MRWRRLALVLALLPSLAACGDDEPTPDTAISFELLDGGTASFADYEGTPLVVNFFASWCVPCITEMPAFERVHQEYGERVAFLGLAVNDTVEDAREIVDQTGVTWDLGRDPQGELLRELGGIGMPTTALLDRDGDVVEAKTGELSEGELTELIEDHFFS
ncbi:MAG: TlpA family protein disulfide reductase [Acidimicrobiales bacterium]